jgi:hypothetical protein
MTTTMSLKFQSLRTTSTTSNAVGTGALCGAAAGAVICVGAWLSPLASIDRSALALIGVCLALPLGAMCGNPAATPRDSTLIALRALAAAVALATVLTIAEPELWFRTMVWCCAASLIGAAATGMWLGAGLAASVAWLGLCGLPFYYDALPVFRDTAEGWALGGSPWLGFSQDAFGGDPLRRPVMYLGRMSELTDKPAGGLLSAGTLWIAGVLAQATLMLKTGWKRRSDGADRRVEADHPDA